MKFINDDELNGSDPCRNRYDVPHRRQQFVSIALESGLHRWDYVRTHEEERLSLVWHPVKER